MTFDRQQVREHLTPIIVIVRHLTGHLFPTEVAMTMVIGTASAARLAAVARWRTTVGPVRAGATVTASAASQLLAFRVSLLPYVAQR